MAHRPSRALVGVAVALALLCAFARHAIQQTNASFNAADLTLPNGIPARLVLPGPSGGGFRLSLPEGMHPPPLVILTHGIIGSKEMMASLAHAFARHDIAVLTMDWGGHAENPHPFNRFTQRDQLRYVIDFMRAQYGHLIDGGHVAVMGHSMGGGATMDYAANFDDIDAAVAIAAGWLGAGPLSPRNVLFIYAEHDLPPVLDGVPVSMRELTGEAEPTHDHTYGSFADGSARRMTRVPGTEHIGVISSALTAREIVHWLREIWPVAPDGEFGDPRLRWVLVAFVGSLALTCVTVPLLRPWLPVTEKPVAGGWVRRLVILGALDALAVLLLNGPNPFGFVGAWGGDYLIGFFFVGGVLLLGYTAATGVADWGRFRREWAATLGTAFVLALIAYVCFGSASTAGWVRFTLAQHRLPLFLWQAVPTILFCMGQDALTKRGSTVGATIMSLAAAFLLAVVFVVASRQHMTPGAVMLVMPVMLPLILAFEVPSLAIYRYTRNGFLSGAYRGLVLVAFGAAVWPLD